MTDIQRHLKGIRKILQRSIEKNVLEFPAIKQDLRAFLPKSYGIGSGRIVSDDGSSLPVQLLLYDRPLAAGMYFDDATAFRIEHTLLVLDVGLNHDVESFSTTVERMASVKRLQTFRVREPRQSPAFPPGQIRRTIPKDRLPFALVYFDRLEGSDNDSIFAGMYRVLSHHSLEDWPDQIDVMGQGAQFLNPLLERTESRWYDMGWSRVPDLQKPEICYVCKQKFFRQHFFYKQLCMECGDLNYQKRVSSADLWGYRVLVTGARVKIGYAVALRLLRAGADVIITSRFPHDAAKRYIQEPDFAAWRERLHIYGLDLRDIPRAEAFVTHLYETYPYLDAIINNAAQTVKRPPAYYAHLIPFETAPTAELPAEVRVLLKGNSVLPTAGSLVSGLEDVFPIGQLDEHGQQIDNRDFTSWVMRLEDVPISELVEVHLVNAIAPAVFAGQLKELLVSSPHSPRFIVNVSAAEGRFTQFKSGHHPHTNMAKAALNMLTRTIADDYAVQGICVISVDPGWVSDQVPRTSDLGRTAAATRIPIDLTDAASRICDPLFSAVQGETVAVGRLFKDYDVVDW